MKNKKFNLFITSNDVNSFGKSISISKYYIYFILSFSFIILFFSFFGFYYIFFNKINVEISKINNKPNVSNPQDSLLFLKDPVQFKNGNFETSFVTNVFNDNAHIGIDINGKHGTKIYSPMPGKVIYEGNDKKLGNIILIAHNSGYMTKYMHNKKNFVKVGDKISLDKAIAEMGNSGSLVKSEGIHLHFELWKDGTPVDPLPFIKDLKSIDSNTLVFNKN